jgi:hypothetical protein
MHTAVESQRVVDFAAFLLHLNAKEVMTTMQNKREKHRIRVCFSGNGFPKGKVLT